MTDAPAGLTVEGRRAFQKRNPLSSATTSRAWPRPGAPGPGKSAAVFLLGRTREDDNLHLEWERAAVQRAALRQGETGTGGFNLIKH